MASITTDPASGYFHIRFRFGSPSFKRSLKTKNRRETEVIQGRVVETILLIERGHKEIPVDADPGTFILSNGKTKREKRNSKCYTISELFLAHDRLPPGSKEPTTLYTESIHKRHLLRILGKSTSTESLQADDFQNYVNGRLKEKYQGRLVTGETGKKKLITFGAVWRWGVSKGYLNERPAPIDGLIYPKSDEKPPFMTWAEIERQIGCGGLTRPRQSWSFWID